MISAVVVADSVFGDCRLSTIECCFHRFVLPQVLTHRVFSRNAGSSRAVSVSDCVESVLFDTAFPVEFGVEQKGMVSGGPVDDGVLRECLGVWSDAASDAVVAASRLVELGVHKQVANRLLEPFLWQKMLISSTDFSNFFAQRRHDDAQPEHALFAERVFEALEGSVPVEVPEGGWHAPFSNGVTEDDLAVSVARCARVSYLKAGGDRDADLRLADRLLAASPPHSSPFEHVATPGAGSRNFEGWVQLRELLEAGFLLRGQTFR